MLARAVSQKARGRSWERVAFENGVHRRTLERTAEKLLDGMPLPRLFRMPERVLGRLQEVIERVLRAQ